MNHDDVKSISAKNVPCCPELAKERCCERLIYTYRLVFNLSDTPVEVVIRVMLERCPGPMALGDLVYSTTLLPGEKVRLFTSNRKNRFTFDSASQVSYRHEQASEESYYMSSVDRFMQDFSTRDQGSSVGTTQGSSHVDASTSSAIETLLFGPSASVNGSFSGRTTFDFLREVSGHAQSSHERSVAATRAASSISIGEVQSRSHAEGESESSFESSTRTISNENRCHAVTYFAYQIEKSQTVRLKIVSVLRRVIDPAGDAKVDANPPRFAGAVSVIPQGVLAGSTERLQAEAVGRTSSVADRAGVVIGGGQTGISAGGIAVANRPLIRERITPMAEERAAAALKAVDEQLMQAGVIDRAGNASEKLRAEIEFERTTCIPTSAILVKGCIDECNVCEPARQEQIKLELRRLDLKNQLLEKQIQLLEKSQEYRCCPVGEAEDED